MHDPCVTSQIFTYQFLLHQGPRCKGEELGPPSPHFSLCLQTFLAVRRALGIDRAVRG